MRAQLEELWRARAFRIAYEVSQRLEKRVGRAPLRKLSRKDRLIGPAAELAERGGDCSGILDAAEMAFRFQNVDGDEESFELGKIMAEKNADEVVQEVCGLQPNEKLNPPS